MATPIKITYRSGVQILFRELESNGTNSVGLKAPDFIAADKLFILPAADGFAGQALVTDGACGLSFADGSAAMLVNNNIWTGIQHITNTTNSSGITTGALIVDGGVGIKLDLFVGGKLGYAAGSGGAVTQITSKATGVALSKICGQITTSNASLADATTVSFVVTNPNVKLGSTIMVNHASGGTTGAYQVNANNIVAGTSFNISIRNISGAPLAEAIVLNFAIFMGSNS